ncbi:N-acetylmuramoyl-L-alanine amidase [Chenggangzhangella methanolivorans]|uniref:N-acetylmuramoyl-L-alanine amidase n=1 Tax=Chenggangzhangella methanolivorans TaxID=1437009 RepID=UPI003614795D
MVFSVNNHRLMANGAPAPFVASPNRGAALQPLYLILHYTAGLRADGAISWFQNPAAQASAHLVIDRDGATTQMVEFNRIAWHAGKSSWSGLDGLNKYSIGIEIANAGRLSKGADGKWRNWANNVVPDADVIVATHKHENTPAGWQRYTADQIEAVIEIGVALHQKYGFADVLGHEDVSPGRKVDTGPAFPMGSVAGKIMGRK